MTATEPRVRTARISKCSPETAEAYLPGNYEVVAAEGDDTLIAGRDHCGWTLDDYVIPRLGSGLYVCRESFGEVALTRLFLESERQAEGRQG